MKTPKSLAIRLAILVFTIALTSLAIWHFPLSENSDSLTENPDEIIPPFNSSGSASSSFRYSFNSEGTLNETGAPEKSSSPYWWLDSGGELIIEEGVGKTIQGEVSFLSKWGLAYRRSNSRDTDRGAHPQNVFRLLTKSSWQNFTQQIYFKITKVNFSESEYRNQSNGVLLMNRYLDSNNLYYAGLRVDGASVIKKKKAGIYYTLAYQPAFTAEAAYDAWTNPNLLPGHRWLGIKAEIKNNLDNTVSIRLYADKNQTGVWTLILEAKDDGLSFGGPALLAGGLAGIRTDFMNVEFENYEIFAI